MNQVVSLALDRYFAGRASLLSRPNKQIDVMQAALVNKCSHGSVVQVIQSAPVETKILTGKVFNRGSEIHLTVEPGLDCMLIGGKHVGQVAGLQGANP